VNVRVKPSALIVWPRRGTADADEASSNPTTHAQKHFTH
jgi:hypothetical protein